MILTCEGCGVEKDDQVKEVYPWAEEEHFIADPITPFMYLEVQDYDPTSSEYRLVRVCHACFHKLKPDHWISRANWDSIGPVVPWENLPHTT